VGSSVRSPDPALAAAIDWMVLLRSGEASDADAERHRAWQAADPRHAAAWAQVNGAMQRSLQPLRQATQASAAQATAARLALARGSRRRVLRAGLAWTGVAVAAGLVAQRQWPAAGLLADLRTGTGQRRDVLLADGSRLVMNARTAVDLRFDGAIRQLHLREGELIVQVAADPLRPFVVRTAEGRVQALGTRFLVRQNAGETLALVLQHSVQLRAAGGAERTLREGEAARFSQARIGDVEADAAAAASLASWERGMLSAHDRPLAELIEALRPYRRGFIRLSPEAGQLRVLGAFPLDDTDRALESLAQTLPIRLTRYGAWLVSIDVRQ